MRQLLLDPAVNHEFERILKALEDKTAEAKRLNEELNATSFTYESKQGRLLVAKCRTLTVSLQYSRHPWQIIICGSIVGRLSQVSMSHDHSWVSILLTQCNS